MKLLHGIAHVAVALWVGAVAAVSFIVAPRAFEVFTKSGEAGDFLRPVFAYVDMFGVGAAALYVLLARRSRMRAIVAGILGAAAAINVWGISPRLAFLDSGDANFALFHRTSMALWLTILVGGVALIFLGPPPVKPRGT